MTFYPVQHMDEVFDLALTDGASDADQPLDSPSRAGENVAAERAVAEGRPSS